MEGFLRTAVSMGVRVPLHGGAPGTYQMCACLAASPPDPTWLVTGLARTLLNYPSLLLPPQVTKHAVDRPIRETN